MSYIKQEEDRQIALLKEQADWFDRDPGGGIYRKHAYPHLLLDQEHNLWKGLRSDAVRYFKLNKIKWHTHAHNLKSSQVACVNHLMGIRKNKDLILKMLNACSPKTEFVDLLTLPYEAETYIGFEVVSGADWLNEGKLKRGSNCTSLDALIYALDAEGKKWLIPVEWKYTEHYYMQDKGAEAGGKGETRHARYDALIQHSKFLCPQTKAVGSIYYQEPFYQLMRQTLWAEQIIRQTFAQVKPELQAEFDTKEQFQADAVLHLHIIPRANKYIVPTKFSKEPIEKLWRGQLINPESYQVIDPKDLFAPIAKDLGRHWMTYLEARYW
ncbi:PGN_0703 family putative restriction endonuclease [Porphyromonas gulae]|uniref:Uncharacterized protein n=1 Tax=Porphyromonas gulae TaxID=111105 RepID=A0A0A2F709_9PORP|nr:hypothetical protein [Porphyromonas gulae]KGN84234.1 hypothetical protein HR15_11215 [Porphyromonas gulae]